VTGLLDLRRQLLARHVMNPYFLAAAM